MGLLQSVRKAGDAPTCIGKGYRAVEERIEQGAREHTRNDDQDTHTKREGGHHEEGTKDRTPDGNNRRNSYKKRGAKGGQGLRDPPDKTNAHDSNEQHTDGRGLGKVHGHDALGGERHDKRHRDAGRCGERAREHVAKETAAHAVVVRLQRKHERRDADDGSRDERHLYGNEGVRREEDAHQRENCRVDGLDEEE